MGPLKTIGGKIAVAPIKSVGIKADVRPGFVTVANKTELVELDVLIDSETLPAGSKVWVLSEMSKMSFASQVYAFGGLSFILIPYASVLMERRGEPVGA